MRTFLSTLSFMIATGLMDKLEIYYSYWYYIFLAVGIVLCIYLDVLDVIIHIISIKTVQDMIDKVKNL